MRLATLVLLLAAPLNAPVGGATPPPACAGPLVINEFLAGPARDWNGDGVFSTRDDEWVEVLNAGGAPLDLGGFFLTDGDSMPRYAFEGALDPGGRRVVFGRDAYEWERATGHPAFGLSLGNTGDAVLLWQVAGGETLLVDSRPYRAHEAGADRAVGRSPDGGASWALFDGLNPYLGATPPAGNGCAPSPGAPNRCDTTPAHQASWGRLKTRYR